MKYEVHFAYRDPQVFDDASDAASAIVSDEDYISEMDYDESDVFDYDGRVDVLGVDYWPSEIIRAVDEDRYNEMIESEKQCIAENSQDDVESELENMSADEETRFPGNIRVVCLSDEEDEYSEVELNEDLVQILDYAV